MKKHTALAFLLLFLLTKTAFAQFSINALPGNPLKFDLKPGENKTASVKINNDSSKEILLKIYAADATRSKNGGFAVALEEQEPLELGLWTKPEKAEIKLLPYENSEVDFTINIPADSPAGDYAGGIVVREINPETKQEIKSSSRAVSGLFVTVAGNKIYNLTVTDFSYNDQKPDQIDFYLKLKNNNNGSIKVKTAVTVEELWGLVKYQLPAKELTLYKNDQPTVKFTWNKNPLFGVFKAAAKINTTPDLKIKDPVLRFTEIKWGKLLTGFGIIMLLGLVIYFRKK